MKFIAKIRKRINRYRHGKGFGVHSPFAFHFITTILNCKYSYYGYSEIEEAIPTTKSNKILRHDAKLILRLIARYNIKSITLPKNTHKAIFIAAKTAYSGIEIISSPQENHEYHLTYIDSVSSNLNLIINSLSSNHNILVFRGLYNKELYSQFSKTTANMSAGAIFKDDDIAIVFTNKKLPSLKYDTPI